MVLFSLSFCIDYKACNLKKKIKNRKERRIKEKERKKRIENVREREKKKDDEKTKIEDKKEEEKEGT